MTVLTLIVLSLLPAVPAGARQDDPYVRLQWGVRAVEATRAWPVATGVGTIVAVIDTGVDAAHPDLAGRILPGTDLVDGDDDPADENGHGTLIAGIIAGGAGDGVGGVGVAPDASILPVRVLDEDGVGRSSDVADGIAFAIAHGANVINLSLAQDTANDPAANLLAAPEVDDAIRSAVDAGVTVVIAAGNSPTGGRGETAYNARGSGALVVGAVTKRDRPAAYGNHGDGLDLVAPGGGSAADPRPGACSERNGIVAAWWNPHAGASSYGAGCGTSMAVAFVSAAAAMLHQSGLTNREATERIVATVDDLGTPGRDALTGAGRLNVARALGVPDPVRVVEQAPAVGEARAPASHGATPEVRVSSRAVTRAGAAGPAPVAAVLVPTASSRDRAIAIAGLFLLMVLAVHLAMLVLWAVRPRLTTS